MLLGLYNALITPFAIFSQKGSWDPKHFTKKADAPLIWLHAVSVGEVRGIATLAKLLKGHGQIVVSTITKTGLEAAKEVIPFADHHFILPIDTKKNARALVAALKPSLFVLMETDFWPNLLYALKGAGAQIVLANGKLSKTSLKKYKRFPYVAKWVFAPFTAMGVQSERYAADFRKLCPQKITVTGNLKCDTKPLKSIDREALKKACKLTKHIVVIGSTHEGEETLLVKHLESIQDIQIVIVPRHPERFERVAEQLKCGRLSRGEVGGRVLLVDAMGALQKFYQIADIAIVGGSFVKGIGGHNILEPMAFGVPTFFGPYMEAQRDIAHAALSGGGAQQIRAEALQTLTQDHHDMALKGKEIVASLRGGSEKTLNLIDLPLS